MGPFDDETVVTIWPDLRPSVCTCETADVEYAACYVGSFVDFEWSCWSKTTGPIDVWSVYSIGCDEVDTCCICCVVGASFAPKCTDIRVVEPEV